MEHKLSGGIFRWLFAAVVCLQLTGAVSVPGQTAAPISATAAQSFDIGFLPNETLVYEGKVSRSLLKGISVGEMTFTVAETKVPNAGQQLQFTAEAVSKGTLVKLFRVSFLQRFESTVDPNAFNILHTVQHDEQGKRVRNGEARFDYQAKRVTYRETDPNNPMNPARVIVSPLETAPTHDIVTAIYYLRRQPLAVGKTFELTVSNAGVIYQIPVRVVAREQQDSIFGTVQTLRAELEIFGERRLIADPGEMTVWFTDDARHLPVRSQVKANFGKVEIKLRRAENLLPLGETINR